MDHPVMTRLRQLIADQDKAINDLDRQKLGSADPALIDQLISVRRQRRDDLVHLLALPTRGPVLPATGNATDLLL
jgi:hypothetical protein